MHQSVHKVKKSLPKVGSGSGSGSGSGAVAAWKNSHGGTILLLDSVMEKGMTGTCSPLEPVMVSRGIKPESSSILIVDFD